MLGQLTGPLYYSSSEGAIANELRWASERMHHSIREARFYEVKKAVYDDGTTLQLNVSFLYDNFETPATELLVLIGFLQGDFPDASIKRAQFHTPRPEGTFSLELNATGKRFHTDLAYGSSPRAVALALQSFSAEIKVASSFIYSS